MDGNEIQQGRAWLKELDWPDMDLDGIDELTDSQVVRAVERHFEGGVQAFLLAVTL